MNETPETEMTFRLTTYGWVPWLEASALLGDADATWLAPSGMARRGDTPWPRTMPVTTRIHAWSRSAPSICWRLAPRPSRGGALVTALTSSESSPPAGRTRSRAVAVTRTVDGDWARLWVTESASVMFLRPAGG